MKHTEKATFAVAAVAVGILVGAGGTMVIGQLTDDPGVDSAPAAVTTLQPRGPGHVIDPDADRPFSPNVNEGTPTNWRRLMDDVETPQPGTGGAPSGGYEALAPTQSITDNSDRTLQWVLFAAAAFSGLAALAVVGDLLARRRWRQPPLESALAATGPDELPRAAGLLGDLFARQDCDKAAEHAYQAAIDLDDAYWSPIAQVALADLLSYRGEHQQAQTLLEAAIASGHPRTVPAAQARLDQLSTGGPTHAAIERSPNAYETLSDPASARRT
jgi:hypothetical protein